MTFIFHENVRYFSLLLGENGLDNGVHFTSELSDFDTFHLVDALTYARKQSFSSNSSLIRTFLGGYFALGEGISRVAVSDQCKTRLRSKCAILYGVCR